MLMLRSPMRQRSTLAAALQLVSRTSGRASVLIRTTCTTTSSAAVAPSRPTNTQLTLLPAPASTKQNTNSVDLLLLLSMIMAGRSGRCYSEHWTIICHCCSSTMLTKYRYCLILSNYNARLTLRVRSLTFIEMTNDNDNWTIIIHSMNKKRPD